MRGKQSNPVRNEQTMEVLREEKQLRFCPWMNKQQEERENWKCVSLQHSCGEKKICVRGWTTKSWVECACGWGLIVLPPHFQDHNYLNHQHPFLMKVVGIKQRKKTYGFFSHWPRLTISPTPILVKIMPLSHFSCRDRSWLGSFLIIDAYLHDDRHNICRMPNIPSMTIQIQNIT